MRERGRENQRSNSLTPRMSVLIYLHCQTLHYLTCPSHAPVRSAWRGLSYRTSTLLLVFSQCSFCKPQVLKEALQKEGLSRSIGSVHQRPSMSLCSQWPCRAREGGRGVVGMQLLVWGKRGMNDCNAKWGFDRVVYPARGRQSMDDRALQTG